MRLTQKGQVTVPKHMRDQVGLTTGTEVEFELTEAGLLLRPRLGPQTERMKAGIRSIRGTADTGMSTDTILKLTRE